MSFTTTPNEILCIIIELLDDISDILSLSQVNRTCRKLVQYHLDKKSTDILKLKKNYDVYKNCFLYTNKKFSYNIDYYKFYIDDMDMVDKITKIGKPYYEVYAYMMRTDPFLITEMINRNYKLIRVFIGGLEWDRFVRNDEYRYNLINELYKINAITVFYDDKIFMFEKILNNSIGKNNQPYGHGRIISTIVGHICKHYEIMHIHTDRVRLLM